MKGLEGKRLARRRTGVTLTAMETRGEVILRAAELADEQKYEFFSVPEGWGFDCSTPLASVWHVSNR